MKKRKLFILTYGAAFLIGGIGGWIFKLYQPGFISKWYWGGMGALLFLIIIWFVLRPYVNQLFDNQED